MTYTTSKDCAAALDDLHAKIDMILDAAVPSPRSELVEYHFDAYMNEISIASEHYYNGTQKTYTVKFDDNAVIDDDVEYETETDGGYCAYRCMPKAVRTACEEIAHLSVEIEALENLMYELQEKEEQAVEQEELKVELQGANADSMQVIGDAVKVIGKCTLKSVGAFCYTAYLHKDKKDDYACISVNDYRKSNKPVIYAIQKELINRFEPLRAILKLSKKSA